MNDRDLDDERAPVWQQGCEDDLTVAEVEYVMARLPVDDCGCSSTRPLSDVDLRALFVEAIEHTRRQE